MHTISKFWQLARGFWSSEERGRAAVYLLLVIACTISAVGVQVLTSYWNLHFYNALQSLDVKAFTGGVVQFIALESSSIACAVIAFHFQQKLIVSWRHWLTEDLKGRWLENSTHYRMKLAGTEGDNPDQRIAEDVLNCVEGVMKLGIGLLHSISMLAAFAHILWTISADWSFELASGPLHIPGFLLWAAVVFAVAGTWLAVKLGRPLSSLNFLQEKNEADFRFALMRVREHSESIAMQEGEPREHERLQKKLVAALDNYWSLSKRNNVMQGYSLVYSRFSFLFPLLLMAPRFFAGRVSLGQVTQAMSAFEEVKESLAFVVNIYPEWAKWQAVVTRLSGFEQRLTSTPTSSPLQFEDRAGVFILHELQVFKPDGEALFKPLSLHLKPGDSLLIKGPSGTGKTALLRSLAGLWPHARGSAAFDRTHAVFAAQHAYLPIGSLRSCLIYPSTDRFAQTEIEHSLSLVGLDYYIDRLEDDDDWSRILSLGERQRLVFARLLLAMPAVLFVDEISANLDPEREAELYQALIHASHKGIIVSVGHHSALESLHRYILELSDSGTWLLTDKTAASADGRAQVQQPALFVTPDLSLRPK